MLEKQRFPDKRGDLWNRHFTVIEPLCSHLIITVSNPTGRKSKWGELTQTAVFLSLYGHNVNCTSRLWLWTTAGWKDTTTPTTYHRVFIIQSNLWQEKKTKGSNISATALRPVLCQNSRAMLQAQYATKKQSQIVCLNCFQWERWRLTVKGCCILTFAQ